MGTFKFVMVEVMMKSFKFIKVEAKLFGKKLQKLEDALGETEETEDTRAHLGDREGTGDIGDRGD